MARQEEPREDLLREATALGERIELRRPGDNWSLVIGFRRDGGGSLYVGADYVLQFTSMGQLRRAFDQGQMLKAEAGRIVALDRQRSDRRGVELVRDEWSVERQRQWLLQAQSQLEEILQQIQAQAFMTVGQVPAEADVRGRVIRWLQSLPRPLQVASRPHAKTKN
jgi:hypothetical protein